MDTSQNNNALPMWTWILGSQTTMHYQWGGDGEQQQWSGSALRTGEMSLFVWTGCWLYLLFSC